MFVVQVRAEPSTPAGYIPRLIKFTLAAFLVMIVFDILAGVLGDKGGALPGFFYVITQPLSRYILALPRLAPQSEGEAGLYCIFALAFIRVLIIAIPMTRIKLWQIESLRDQGFAPAQSASRFWFIWAAFLVTGACLLGYVSTNLPNPFLMHIVKAAKLAVYLGAMTAALSAVVIGFKLRGGISLPRSSSAPKAKAKPKLKLMVDNTAPAKPDEASEGRAFYVALTAGIIQSAGRFNRLPTQAELEEPLKLQQKAALATRNALLSDAEITARCKIALELLEQGKVQNLPDLKTAITLYKKPDPAKLMQIALELQGLMG